MNILETLDRPLMSAASAASSIVYSTFRCGPRRQKIYLELALASVEIGLSVMVGLNSWKEHTVVWGLLSMLLFVEAVGNIAGAMKNLWKWPASYDAQGYREAMASAARNRTPFHLLIRLMTAVFPALIFLDLVVWKAGEAYRWMEFGGLLYFVFYCGKFHLRACDPPKPDEGDFFAHPAQARS